MKFFLKTKMMYFFTLFLGLVFSFPNLWAQDEGEETYTISLTQTAEIDKEKEIVEFEDKKVLTERYAVKEGDHLWQLLRERDLLKKKELPDIITILKHLNSNLENLDLIHPGQTIVIPLIISPAKGMPVAPKQAPPKAVSIKEVEGMELESFTVKSGDTLVQIIREQYNIPEGHLYDDYLRLVKKLNPSIDNLDTIYPGQKIRLPIYSPQIVRKPIEAPPAPKPAPETPPRLTPSPATKVGKKLGDLFTLLGEEWVHTGEHFIPIKSGGHVNLSKCRIQNMNINASGNSTIASDSCIIENLNYSLRDSAAAFIQKAENVNCLLGLEMTLKKICLKNQTQKAGSATTLPLQFAISKNFPILSAAGIPNKTVL